MDTQILSLVLNVLQTLAIVVSLWMVAYQLKQSNQSFRQDASTKVADYFFRISETVLYKRPIVDQIYQHNTDYLKLSEDQKELYNGLNLIFLFYESLYILYKLKGVDRETWQACENWLVQDILSLDMFETFWNRQKTTYHKGMYQHIDEMLRLLKKSTKTGP